ncbi:MAG: pyridoxamine 5'-phosphate oxidase family protein [Candidatus Nomurabacteria bacterium]|nr:MAG: pyridoxamine 5'-phosphate oxidase family protein [Candidatus Nomurabacteria bacterium]
MPLTIESTSSSNSEYLIRDFLASHNSGVLATSDSSANPHGAVIYYAVDDGFCLLFATKSETQKNKNLEENNRAEYVIYDEAAQSQLQVSGHVVKINDPDAQRKILNSMYSKSAELSHEELPPAEKLFAGDFVAYKLIPSVMKMAVYARPDSEEADDLFETLLFSNETNAN